MMHVEWRVVSAVFGATKPTNAVALQCQVALPAPVLAVVSVKAAAPVGVIRSRSVFGFPRMAAFARTETGVPNAVRGNGIRGVALLTDTFRPRHGGSGALWAAKAAGVVSGRGRGKIEQLATALAYALDTSTARMLDLALPRAKVVLIGANTSIMARFAKKSAALFADKLWHPIFCAPSMKTRTGAECRVRVLDLRRPSAYSGTTLLASNGWHMTSFQHYMQITDWGK